MSARQTGVRNVVLATLAVLIGVGISCPAWAQPADKSESVPVEETDGETPEGPLDDKMERFWSVDQDLDVVKKREYERDDRFSIGLHGGILSTEPYYNYYPVGASASYHWSNNWGVELGGRYMSGPLRQDGEVTSFLKSNAPGFDEATGTDDRLEWQMEAVAVWHPLYGKLSLLQKKLSHFDIVMAMGLGMVGAERPDFTRTDVESVVEPSFVFGLGGQLFVTEDLLVRLEARGYAYQGAAVPSTGRDFGSRLDVGSTFVLGFRYLL